MNNEFYEIVERICDQDPRYRREAYEFVMESLTFTQRKLKRSKHVSGPELLKGIQLLLLEKFGPMTLTVLKHWGIENTEDFGNIVFNLVEHKVLSKTEDDKHEHFLNGFDFKEVFEHKYRHSL